MVRSFALAAHFVGEPAMQMRNAAISTVVS